MSLVAYPPGGDFGKAHQRSKEFAGVLFWRERRCEVAGTGKEERKNAFPFPGPHCVRHWSADRLCLGLDKLKAGQRLGANPYCAQVKQVSSSLNYESAYCAESNPIL